MATVLEPAIEEARADTAPRVLIDPLPASYLLAAAAISPLRGAKFLMAIGLCIAALSVLKNRSELRQLWVSWAPLAFVSWAVLSLGWSMRPPSTVLGAFLTVTCTLFCWLVAAGRNLEQFLRLFCAVIMGLLIISFAAAVLFPQFGQTQDAGRVGEVQGVFGHKNQFGLVGLISITAATCALAADPRRRRAWLWATLVLGVVAVITAGSRTAIGIGILCAAGTPLLRGLARARKPWGVAVGSWSLIIGVVGVTVIGQWATILRLLGRDPTLTNRTNIWAIVWSYIQERPIIGYGWNGVFHADAPFALELWSHNHRVPFWHSHNGYLDIWLHLGVVGLVLGVGLLLRFLALSAREFWVHPGPLPGFALVLAFIIFSYQGTEVMAYEGVVWMLVVSLTAILERDRRLRCI